MPLNKRKRNPDYKLIPGLVLMGLQTTGHWAFLKLLSLKVGSHLRLGTYDVFNNNNSNENMF